MPETPTPYLNLYQPSTGESDWGAEFRANQETIDAAIQTLAAGGEPVPTQIQLDYEGRPDDLPVFLGRAPINAADAEASWTVTKFYYDGDRLLHTEVRTNIAWSNRTSPLDPWPVT